MLKEKRDGAIKRRCVAQSLKQELDDLSVRAQRVHQFNEDFTNQALAMCIFSVRDGGQVSCAKVDFHKGIDCYCLC